MSQCSVRCQSVSAFLPISMLAISVLAMSVPAISVLAISVLAISVLAISVVVHLTFCSCLMLYLRATEKQFLDLKNCQFPANIQPKHV